VKDTFDTAGIRTTYGSAIFRDHIPVQTATAVARLEEAGAILVGKANQHEFAWGTTSQNPHWGTVANPVRPGRVAGGSSGGTAAALADQLCMIGLGTDTGGSVRIPSACCDTVGFKPAFDVVPTEGAFPLAPSFDTVGPMACSVADCALTYSVLTGSPSPSPRLHGMRVGVLSPTGHEDQMSELGAYVEEYTLPTPEADITPVFVAECAFTHIPWFPERREDYNPDAQAKFDAAQQVTALAYHRGLRAMKSFRAQAAEELSVDVLVSPTLGMEPPPDDCWEPDVREALGRFTRGFNFLGWPAMAVGNLQIAGREADSVLAVALAWEQAIGR
jgi:aspartyl-tRNA(Asn)/glutamyl-tRNA(Gln) amidotransferase subunit A